MSQDQGIQDISLEAAEDLSSYQYYGVGLDANGKACLADGDEAITLGILQNKPQSGEAASVRKLGMTKAVSGGSTTINTPQKFSSGKITDVTTAGDRYNCIALEAADVDGEEVSVIMESGYYYAA